ncbi:carboxymuconolactone decarboxylase family protein [Niabella sp. CJ426]|uniref:carboxymuconolactone decarboxylase family protein n=1 Tax=Niabella sp. CJ426 TaxID=3393740 RepID=UPI003D06F144
MESNPMDLFMKEAPDVARAFDGLIQSLIASNGLDEKTKQLIYIAMKTAMGDDMAVKFHAPMAKQLGATKPEIVDAVLLSLTVSGISGVMASLPAVVKLFENHE